MGLLVGMDAREAFREEPRGIGLYCRHLFREFGELAPDWRFLAYHERKPPADLPAPPPCVVPRRTPMRGGRWHLWERLRMPWQIRRDRVAVYHGTYNTLPPRWRALGGPPMVVTLHDVVVTWWEGDLEDPYVRYCRAVTRRVVRDAERIFTVSEWSRGDIMERFGVAAEKVQVVRNGLHPVFFQDPPPGAAQAARERFAGGRPYLTAIGSALARKNTFGLLEALGILVRRGRLAHRVVVTGVGGAALRALGEASARAGLAETVTFTGHLSWEDLRACYAGADLSVYPSFAEGWGIPVLESMAAGTPVAASRATAIPEAGGPFPRYFDPADREEMAVAVAEGLREGWSSEETREQARAFARRFTWKEAAQALLAAYREVAG